MVDNIAIPPLDFFYGLCYDGGGQMAGSNRLRLVLDSRYCEGWAAIFYFSLLLCWVPVAMYLMHSVASLAVCPLAISQSISLAASVAVMLCSIPFYLLPGDVQQGHPS